MAVQVQAPKRRPRAGGIKDVVGAFVDEPRLSVVAGLTDLAWEDATCGTSLASTAAGCYVADDGVNEVQRLTITGAPTGGTFTLTLLGETTAAIAYNATAAQVEAALIALPSIEAGDLAVTGGPLPGAFVTITFTGPDLGDRDIPQMTVAASLTGGTTPAAAVTTITPGVPASSLAGTGVTIFNTIGQPFARYTGVECFIGGDQDESYESQSRRKFEGLEDRAVEAVLADWAGDAPTPGTATTVAAAIGVAEEHADVNYVGLPVLVMSRQAAEAAYGAGVLTVRDGVLVTGLGTPVIATGTVVAADEPDLIAIIGMPAVYAGPYLSRQAPDLRSNVDLAITMRLFALGVDCNYRYAVNVTAP